MSIEDELRTEETNRIKRLYFVLGFASAFLAYKADVVTFYVWELWSH
jgi:hypothetical protein